MSNLTLFSGSLAGGTGRELMRLERATGREVAGIRARAAVVAERGRAANKALEDVATDAMFSGVQVTQVAVQLAGVCPLAEPMLRNIASQTGLALGRVVADAARDLR